MPIPDASYGSLKKESSINEFDSLVFDGFKTKFGTDFLINFIINPSDGVCGMTFEGDQTFGKRYEDFAKKDPSRIRIYPICANTYEKILSDTSQFITEIIATKFDLNLPISARVVEVYLDSTKIDASKYVISGNTIELRTDLRAGQKLIVKYVQM